MPATEARRDRPEAMIPHGPPAAPPNRTPIAESRTHRRVSWCLAAAIVLAYAFYYGAMVMRHTAVPYFDQTNYISRIYSIHDAWVNCSDLLHCISPELVLGGAFPARPPLLMIPAAALWGAKARPHAVAILWLVLRLAALMLALFLFSHSFQTTRFVPGALLAVLGSAFFLDVHPHLYQMDQPFALFGLLAFALLLRDLPKPSPWTGIPAALGTLALLLIKPVALSFVFPMYVVLATRGFGALVAVWRRRASLAPWLAWVGVYAAMLVAIFLLWRSPYGQAVAQQYKEGSRGYWAWHPTLIDAFQFAALIIPVWLFALLATSLWWQRRIAMPGWLLVCGLVTPIWWYVFNMFLTYTVDPRIIASGMPVAVSSAFLALHRTPLLSSV